MCLENKNRRWKVQTRINYCRLHCGRIQNRLWNTYQTKAMKLQETTVTTRIFNVIEPGVYSITSSLSASCQRLIGGKHTFFGLIVRAKTVYFLVEWASYIPQLIIFEKLGKIPNIAQNFVNPLFDQEQMEAWTEAQSNKQSKTKSPNTVYKRVHIASICFQNQIYCQIKSDTSKSESVRG